MLVLVVLAIGVACLAALAVLMLGVVRTTDAGEGSARTLARLAGGRERIGPERFDAWLAAAAGLVAVTALVGCWAILRG